VVHLDGELDRRRLTGLYRLGDVCVVSALRDGLNLVAEEYVVAADDGVLVLSEGAGVRSVLGEGALLVDPTDVAGVADAIQRALRMDADERDRRLDRLEAAVREHDVARWKAAFLGATGLATPARSD
jgi:trehalose 6-phosphate synthase